ncbi:hypothetical protein A7X12_21955 [Sphingomonas sp. TDK1]|nr:hypothetical protein [Sphingomonas sp. TDK1]OAN62661.1 hypothetical protein A7X12_21955 [Sphingomonas sp. TDK1]
MQQRTTRFAAETNGITQISRIAKGPIDRDDGVSEAVFDLGCADAEPCAGFRIGKPLDGAKLEHRALVVG